MAEVDALEIRIRDNADKAADGLDRLVESVNKIGGIDGSKFQGIATCLNRLHEQLKDIRATTNGLKTSLGSIGRIQPKISTRGMKEALKVMEQFKGFTMTGNGSFKSANELLGTTSRALSVIQPQVVAISTLIRDSFGNLAERVSASFDKPVQDIRSLADILNAVNDPMERFVMNLQASDEIMTSMSANSGFGAVTKSIEGVAEQSVIAMENVNGVWQAVDHVSNVASYTGNRFDLYNPNWSGTPLPDSESNGIAGQMRNATDVIIDNLNPALQESDRLLEMCQRAAERYQASLENVGHYGGTISLSGNAVDTFNPNNVSPLSDSSFDRVYESTARFKQDMKEATKLEKECAAHAKELAKEQAKAAKEAERMAKENGIVNGLKSSLKEMTNFMSMLSRMLKRNIIRKIFEGFTEGVSNLYQWSSSLGDGGAFKSIMDGYSSALLTLVNAIGSASGALLTALYPAFIQIINIVTQAVNVLSQFIAALSGSSTWNKPNDVAKAFEDASNSAKSASKSTKELLADWDELNVITRQGGSGGSSGGTKISVDTNAMFTVTDIEDSIKNITDWLGQWPGLIEAAVAGLTAWILTKNLGLGTLTFGVVLGIEGVKDAISKGEITKEAMASMLLSGLATAASVLLISGCWPLSITAGIIAVGAEWLYAKSEIMKRQARIIFSETGKGGKEIKAALNEAQKSVNEITANNLLVIDAYAKVTAADIDVSEAIDKIDKLHAAVFGSADNPTKQQLADLQKAWDDFDAALTGKQSATSDTILAGLTTAVSNLRGELKDAAIDATNVWLAMNGEISKKQLELITQRDSYIKEFNNDDYTHKNEYLAVVRALSGASEYNTAKYGLNSYSDNLDRIDFGDGEEALQNAMKFIEELQVIFTQATDLNQTAGNDTLSALDEQIAWLEDWQTLGIGDYSKSIEELKAMRKLIEASVSTEADELSSVLTEVYEDLLVQAFSGMENAENKQMYASAVIQPILDSILADSNLNGDDLQRLREASTAIMNAFLMGFDPDYTGMINNATLDDIDFQAFEVWGLEYKDGEWILPVSIDVGTAFSAGIDEMRNSPLFGWAFELADFFSDPDKYKTEGNVDATVLYDPSYANKLLGLGPNGVSHSTHFADQDSISTTDDTAQVVEAGVSNMSASLISKLDEMITALNNKEMSITINPSSALGRVSGVAARMYAQTTGE